MSDTNRTSKTVVYPTPWRLESRNDPIADTGDYDGVITIKSADGKTITEAWNPGDDDVVAFQRIIDVMNAHDSPGVHCVHCNGKGVETQHYDEETGWSDPDVPCATCGGSGRIRAVEQYLKTVPANWHEDSSVRTWFPLLDEEVARLRRAEASCNEHHAEIRPDETDGYWRPIASAPRDGTRVHLGFEHMQNWDVIGHWQDGDWAHGSLPTDRFYGRGQPTHWRPLPRAPGLPEEPADKYCVCAKSQLAEGQHGYHCTACGKYLHPDNYLPEKASACTCEQDDCPHDAPVDQCCGKCRGALNGDGKQT